MAFRSSLRGGSQEGVKDGSFAIEEGLSLLGPWRGGVGGAGRGVGEGAKAAVGECGIGAERGAQKPKRLRDSSLGRGEFGAGEEARIEIAQGLEMGRGILEACVEKRASQGIAEPFEDMETLPVRGEWQEEGAIDGGHGSLWRGWRGHYSAEWCYRKGESGFWLDSGRVG